MYKKTNVVTIFLVIIFLNIFFFSNAVAQEQPKGSNEVGGGGYFMFGWNLLDIEELNSKLENKGYSALSDNFISFGGGGHGIINKLIIGGEGHGLIGQEVTSGNYKSSLSVGYGFFNLGYIIISAGNLKVYPLLGLGGGGMSLRIIEKTPLSFDELLDNPKRMAELSTGGFLLNLSLGTDYLLNLESDAEGGGGLLVGLRFGYTFTPLKGDWKMDEVDISDAPQLGITGPYIRLIIGGGGYGRE